MISTEIQSLRSRPRFRAYFKANPEEIIESFRQQFKTNASIGGTVATHHVFVRVKPEDEHFWSPQLGVEIEEYNHGSLIRGLYGPKPAIWTLFIFFYSTIGLATVGLLFLGLSQWQIDQYPWGLWFVPGGVLTLGGIYLLTQMGQKLSYPQMEYLHEFYKKATQHFESYVPMEEES